MISDNRIAMEYSETPNAKNKITEKQRQDYKKLSADAFIIGVKHELNRANRYIYNRDAKAIISRFEYVNDIDEADKMAKKLLTTLVGENYSQDSRTRSYFRNSPFFNLLFLPVAENNEFEQLFKKYIYDNNSREQHILYSIMNMDYFGTQTTSAEAIEKINKQLKLNDYCSLCDNNELDNIVLECIEEEEKINNRYNLDSNISGLRILSRLLN